MGSDTNRKFVRVLGVRRATFVEFSFAHGDPDLSVELVLPYPAFVELCERYAVETIAPEPEVARAFAELKTKHAENDKRSHS